jgi:hypothetical protein
MNYDEPQVKKTRKNRKYEKKVAHEMVAYDDMNR